MKILNDEFVKDLVTITKLSKKVNGNDKKIIFEMIKTHSNEIQELYNANNKYWSVETADLIVLCFELLISENINIDENFKLCLPRFYKKLNEKLI